MPRPRLPIVSKLFRALVAGAVVCLGVGIYFWLASTRPAAETSVADLERRIATLQTQLAREKERGVAEPVAVLPTVEVFAARRVPVQRQWRGFGDTQATVRADVPARVGATVADVPDEVDAGRPVPAGGLLVQLDPTDFERQVEIGRARIAEVEALIEQLEVESRQLDARRALEEADLGLAASERERVEQLLQRGAGTQQDAVRVRRAEIAAQLALQTTTDAIQRLAPRRLVLGAQLDVLKRNLRVAEEDLSRTRIVSPIDGVIQAVDVKPGESVQPGQRVARVVSLAKVETAVRLPASARGDVALGDALTLRSTGTRSAEWSAKVTRIEPEDDAASRTFGVFAVVDQREQAEQFGSGASDGDRVLLLTPGTFVEATVTVSRSQPRWVVPRRAVKGQRVWVVEDGVVRSRAAHVDFLLEGKVAGLEALPDDQWAVLDDCLREGEAVLVSAGSNLLDGTGVNAVRVDAATAAPPAAAPPAVSEAAPTTTGAAPGAAP